MSLRPTSVTPKSMAARRSNALKSAGPRTGRGMARVCLNALKHGRYAVLVARSARLREKLFEAGQTRQEALYGAVRARVAQTIRAQDPAARRSLDEIALRAWCLALRTHPPGTKLENPLISASNRPQMSTDSGFARRRYSIVDHWTRGGMVFWCQRRRRLSSGFNVRSPGCGEQARCLNSSRDTAGSGKPLNQGKNTCIFPDQA